MNPGGAILNLTGSMTGDSKIKNHIHNFTFPVRHPSYRLSLFKNLVFFNKFLNKRDFPEYSLAGWLPASGYLDFTSVRGKETVPFAGMPGVSSLPGRS